VTCEDGLTERKIAIVLLDGDAKGIVGEGRWSVLSGLGGLKKRRGSRGGRRDILISNSLAFSFTFT
jgi:hypothetical protein